MKPFHPDFPVVAVLKRISTLGEKEMEHQQDIYDYFQLSSQGHVGERRFYQDLARLADYGLVRKKRVREGDNPGVFFSPAVKSNGVVMKPEEISVKCVRVSVQLHFSRREVQRQ